MMAGILADGRVLFVALDPAVPIGSNVKGHHRMTTAYAFHEDLPLIRFTEVAGLEELGENRVGMRRLDQHHHDIALCPQELSRLPPSTGAAGMVAGDGQYARLVLDEVG